MINLQAHLGRVGKNLQLVRVDIASFREASEAKWLGHVRSCPSGCGEAA